MGLKNGPHSYEIVEALVNAGADVHLRPSEALRPGKEWRFGLNAIFYMAFTGQLRYFPFQVERPPWMKAAELLVDHGARWHGDIEKLKIGLARQQELSPELLEDFFCASFLARLKLNNDSCKAAASGAFMSRTNS